MEIGNVLPPARVPLLGRKTLRINVGFPMRHRSAGEKDERNGAGESVVEQKCRRVWFEILRQDAARLQIGHLAGRQ